MSSDKQKDKSQKKIRQKKEKPTVEDLENEVFDLGDIGGTVGDSDTLDRLQDTTRNLNDADDKF